MQVSVFVKMVKGERHGAQMVDFDSFFRFLITIFKHSYKSDLSGTLILPYIKHNPVKVTDVFSSGKKYKFLRIDFINSTVDRSMNVIKSFSHRMEYFAKHYK